MPANIKNVLELLQSKIESIDGNTSISDLEYLFKAAKKAAGTVIHEYDSDGALPDVNDTNVRIAFIKNRGVMAYNNGKWDYAGGDELPNLYALFGSSYGYTAGGYLPTSNVIDKFPFAADGNATDVGDLTLARYDPTSAQSTTHGYCLTGYPSPTGVVDKYSFASDGNATSVTTLAYWYGASETQNLEKSYISGGIGASPTRNATISSFDFATETGSLNVGSLLTLGYDQAGTSSITYGYVLGGSQPAMVNVIQKFPFAISSGTSTDVGDLLENRYAMGSTSSATYGYVSNGSPTANRIQKHQFASDGNSTLVGSIQYANTHTSGNQTAENGYDTGANIPSPAGYNAIQKYPFAADADGVIVGNLSIQRFHASGTSY